MELNVRRQRVLAIGAHPDDIEFGCFGVLAAAAESHVLVLSDGARGGDAQARVREAQQSAELVSATVIQGTQTDTAFSIPDTAREIEAAIDRVQPEVILTMSERDLHQDHAAVGAATLIATRKHVGAVLAYGTPSNLDRFQPQVVIGFDEASMALKLRAIQLHTSQAERHYMREDFIRSIAQHWAAMSRLPADYAEAYELVRWNDVL